MAVNVEHEDRCLAEGQTCALSGGCSRRRSKNTADTFLPEAVRDGTNALRHLFRVLDVEEYRERGEWKTM
jgi:hypothetical protein